LRKMLSVALFYFSAFLLTAMVTSLFIQVLAREFNWDVDWSEELARFSFISAVFLASSYATLTKSHLSVSFFSNYIAKRIGQNTVSKFHTLAQMAFDSCVIYYASINLIDGILYPNISPSLSFNQNYLFILMILGFSLSAMIHIIDIFSTPPVSSDTDTPALKGKLYE